MSLATGWAAWAATARVAAWLNLFNLLPLGPLDGGRGFRSLSRGQRWVATGALAAAWGLAHDGLLLLLFIAAAARSTFGAGAEKPDWGALVEYVGLVVALAFLATIHVPMAP